MRYPLFMVPRVRGLGSRVSVHADSSLGSVNEQLWPPQASTTSVQRLVLHWSGLLRALTLAGYRAVEVFVEAQPATATKQLLLDMHTWGLARVDRRPDGLTRSAGVPLLVALTLDPLYPFGERGGARLALPLPAGELAQIDRVQAVVSETARGWLAFGCAEAGLRDAMASLRERAIAIAERVAAEVSAAWFDAPAALAGPVGSGWMFDSTGWWFPPRPPGAIDEDARILHGALDPVSAAFSGAMDLDEFLTTSLVREDDPHLFDSAGSFGRVTRDWSTQPASAAIDAYVRRVAGLASPNVDVTVDVADALDSRYTWIDAVLTMLEHGAIAVGHRLLPSHPETSLGPNAVFASTPEWTTPQLTGQWDATTTRDTIILNQAGNAINGYWHQRVGSSSVRRFIIDGTKIDGDRNGGPLTYRVKLWNKPAPEMHLNVEATLGPPVDGDADIQVTHPASGNDTLTLVAAVGGGSDVARTFTRSPIGGRAHHTAWTLEGLPAMARERFLQLRDGALHFAELVFVERLIDRAVEYVERFLDEAPSTVALESMMADFRHDVEDDMRLAPGTQDTSRFTDNDELMVRARFYVTATLVELRAPGGDSHLTVLKAMFRATFRTTTWLQWVYGLPILEVPDGAYFRYRWRLRDISMVGAAYVVGGAEGAGTFELQRVDARGQTIGPLISRTIDLKTIEAGMVYGPNFGPDEIKDWHFFDPTYRDITPHLDGATFSMFSMGASWLVASSSSSIEVELGPTDGLPPLTGRIDAVLLEPDLFDPEADPTDPGDVHDQVTKAKDLIDAGKELTEEIAKKKFGRGLLKGAKMLKPDVSITTTFGWLRTAAGAPRKPQPAPIDAGDYVDVADDDWARFATNKYDIAPEFRDRIRQFVLWNLPSLSSIGELVVTGHASQDGPDDYNFRLSRDRAVAALTVLYDIAGPQLAVPLGDVRIVGRGSTDAAGDPDSDEPYDRRVEVELAGQVRLRS